MIRINSRPTRFPEPSEPPCRACSRGGPRRRSPDVPESWARGREGAGNIVARSPLDRGEPGPDGRSDGALDDRRGDRRWGRRGRGRCPGRGSRRRWGEGGRGGGGAADGSRPLGSGGAEHGRTSQVRLAHFDDPQPAQDLDLVPADAIAGRSADELTEGRERRVGGLVLAELPLDHDDVGCVWAEPQEGEGRGLTARLGRPAGVGDLVRTARTPGAPAGGPNTSTLTLSWAASEK